MKKIVESFYNWYSEKLRHPKYRWLIILGTLGYLVLPFDISPDVFPVVGWIDDGIVITLLTTELSKLALDYRRNRKDLKNKSEQEPVNEDTVDATVVETPLEVSKVK